MTLLNKAFTSFQ